MSLEKRITLHLPCCGAPVSVFFDGTSGDGWDRSNDIRSTCPRGHPIPGPLVDQLHEYAEQLARDGENDPDVYAVCGYTEGRR